MPNTVSKLNIRSGARLMLAGCLVLLAIVMLSRSGLFDLVKKATGETDWGASDNALVKVANNLKAPLLGIAVAVAPLTILSGAIAMQLGSPRGPRIIGVGVVALAVVGAATGIIE